MSKEQAPQLTEIPTISLRDLGAAGVEGDECRALTAEAFHQIGFIFMDAPPEVSGKVQRMYDVCKLFFDLPDEVKNQYELLNKGHQRGYTPLDAESAILCKKLGPDSDLVIPNYVENLFFGPDIYEEGDPLNLKYPLTHIPNVWPTEVPELPYAIEPVFQGLYKVGRQVLRALEPKLGKDEGYFDDMVEGSPTLIRPLHYPALSGRDAIRAEKGMPSKIGACNHTDIDLITALPAPTREGLLVKTRSGRWISGKGEEEQLIVQVGDMLEYLTGGYFTSAEHKVIAPIERYPGDPGRYSSAVFLHPKGNYPLEVAEHLAAHPENYPTLGGYDYLKIRLKEIGLSA